MSLLKSSANLYTELETQVKASRNLVLIAPYIKRDVLEKLLSIRSAESKCTVLTTWRPQDVKFGATDLECYTLCKNNHIPLLLNNRIHLKAYFDYGGMAIIGSANLTQAGLGLCEGHNYELAERVELEPADNIYFDQLLAESILVTDEIYEQARIQADGIKDNNNLPVEFKLTLARDHFLLSALPQTDNPSVFYDLYSGKKNGNSEQRQCTAADISKYGISVGLDRNDFFRKLKASFYAHPFIKAFLEYNNSFSRNGLMGRQFGDLRTWIQNKTTQVPTPRRFEINDPLNHVYDWVVELGDGLYEKVQPGTHTWVLRSHKNILYLDDE